jgi:adenosyl cobinamide kinase/adenosyl cobinamide phosphate guanylyltransferase
MSLTFLLGGARSGKSALALRLARDERAPVTVIATAEAGDDEMRERIRLHRAERSGTWTTVEEPLALGTALASVDSGGVVIVDCLSLWVANLVERGDGDAEVEEQSRAAVARVAERSGTTIAVSNEVGLGVVPATPLGRRYRDLLGRINVQWAHAADQALLVVAGRALPLQ